MLRPQPTSNIKHPLNFRLVCECGTVLVERSLRKWRLAQLCGIDTNLPSNTNANYFFPFFPFQLSRNQHADDPAMAFAKVQLISVQKVEHEAHRVVYEPRLTDTLLTVTAHLALRCDRNQRRADFGYPRPTAATDPSQLQLA